MVKKTDLPSPSTEDKILEAAKTVFVQKGMDGASMQQIADEAGINKSLLHYYYRTKEKLFGTVLKYAFKFVMPEIKNIMISDCDIKEKIEKLVEQYMGMLMKNKFIPAFIVHEINRNPESIYQIMKYAGVEPQLFIDQVEEEIRKGNIRPIDPKHLIINIIALCIFPVIARPLAQRLFFGNNDTAYDQFLEERKKIVADFIIQSIQVK